MLRRLLLAAATINDPYWEQTSSVMNFEGPNGSTVFTDAKGKIWAGFGNSKIQDGYLALDGAGDYLTTPQASDLEFGSEDFTLEAIVQFNHIASAQTVISNWRGQNATFCAYIFYMLSAGKIQLSYGVGSLNTGTPSAGTVSVGIPTHIAVCRQGNVGSYFINGIKDSVSFSLVGSINSYPGEPTAIGCISPNTGVGVFLNGRIYATRITKGVARYTEDFIPPESFPEAA